MLRPFQITEPYRPRSVSYLGVHTFAGWRIKQYTIRYSDAPFDAAAFDQILPTALECLPQPPVTPTRPGVGFLIRHQGRTASYVVLCWWDNENELPLRVFVRPPDATAWRSAHANESICVWDLEIVAFERDAYVRHVLTKSPSIDAYVQAVFEVPR